MAPGPPSSPPLGLALAAAAKAVSRAFDEALAEAGGSRPTWLVLMALRRTPTANQTQIAAAVGIRGATLTHHLDAMERDGLLARRRDEHDRRVHVVELTPAGEDAFDRLRRAAVAFDRRLRRGVSAEAAAELGATLAQLTRNVER